MPEKTRRPDNWLALAGLLGFGLALACAVAAWLSRAPDSALAAGAWRLAAYGGFLFFDLVTLTAGITVAALRGSLAWSMLPAAAIALTFVMLFPAFEAFQAVRH